MSRLQAILLLVVTALVLCVALLGTRLIDRQRLPRVEMGAAQRVALAEAAGETIRGLGDPVVATYFVTRAERMPSPMRRVEREVADSLDALARASGGLLRWDRLHTDDEVVEKLATRYDARPFPVRTVLRDGHAEQTVHSSLVLAAGPRPPVTINGITAEHAIRLPGLIAAHLERMRDPRQPRIAIASPAGYGTLERLLAQFGPVTRVDLDDPAVPFPADADLLVWIQPQRMNAQRVRDIELFLDRGRSAILAGSRRAIAPSIDGRRAEFRTLSWGLDPLLDAFGLRAIDGLVVDPPRAEARTPLPTGVAPFHMRNIGADQDFRLLSEHLSASVLFAAPTPIALAEAGASRDGWSFETLASTSDGGAVLSSWPDGLVDPAFAMTVAAHGDPLPRAPLIGLLRPHDPWRGSVVFLASPLPLADGMLDRDGFGHRKLLGILMDSLAGSDRLVTIDAETTPVPPVPELAAAQRIRWRLLCVLPLPILLLGIGLWRRRAARDSIAQGTLHTSPSVSRAWGRRLAPIGAAAAVIAIVGVVAAIVSAGAARAGVRSDLTVAGSNSLAPQTLVLAEAAPAIEAELFATDRMRLPPRLRRPVADLEAMLADVAARTTTLSLRVVRPETLDGPTRGALAESGVVESTFTDRDEEVTVVRRFTCVLRLRAADGRIETLVFPDEASLEHAEFRLAFALWRLERRREIVVAVISDRPRPTPAEAHEFFQLQGLQPPMGTDVYSLARQTLARHDFRVVSLDHRQPQPPDDADLLLWLQPRRPGQMLPDVLSRWLHSGRPAIVAAQQFNIQARLYPGRDHRVVYWPQPQWPDMQGGWFAAIGATMPRLVVLDELQLASRAEAQVMGRNERRFTEHETSLPFLVRAAAGNFDRAHPLARGLGDQGFVWSSFIQLDPATLSRRSIDATVLMTTSPRAWTFAWEGGFLPTSLLEGPVDLPDDDGVAGGRLPLAVVLEGRFPIAGPEETDFIDPTSLVLAEQSRLMLIAGSELFKNNRLRDPDYRGDHFLLNAVSALVADARLTEILTRRTVPLGLDYVEPERRLRWRAVVVLLPAAALLAVGLLVTVARRATPPRLRTTPSATDADAIPEEGRS